MVRQVHSETKQIEYSGAVLELAECLSRLPAGGQTFISGTTFQRIAGRLQASTINSSKYCKILCPFGMRLASTLVVLQDHMVQCLILPGKRHLYCVPVETQCRAETIRKHALQPRIT